MKHARTRMVSLIGVLGLLLGCVGTSIAQQPTPQPAATAQPAPAVQPAPGGGEKKPEEPPTCLGPDGKQHTFPLKVYDENADGMKTIADAMVKAKAEGKRVLAMWGENWCQFCLFLEDILANDPGCKPIVKSDYIWVRIDYGQGFARGQAKHMDLSNHYGVTQWKQRPDGKTMGAPALCIIDPETSYTVGTMDPQRDCLTGVLGGNDMVAKPMLLNHLFDEVVIKKFLIENRAPAKPATGAMNAALGKAKAESKKVLATFVMPDPDCDKFAAWLDRADVAAALGNTFVPVKIDTERMIGGREMLTAASGKPVFPPFMTVLDATGKPIAEAPRISSLPKNEAEIEAFIKELAKGGKIGDADKAVLAKSLKEAAAASIADKK
jgi:hypothetical protein